MSEFEEDADYTENDALREEHDDEMSKAKELAIESVKSSLLWLKGILALLEDDELEEAHDNISNASNDLQDAIEEMDKLFDEDGNRC